MTNITTAASAYQNQLKLMQSAPPATDDDQASGPSFLQMAKGAFDDAVATQHNAENHQMQALTGNNVDITDLVSAVSNAQMSLSTIVAVRDKVINAYQDIIKMSI